jgi:hypothetical protein
MKKVIYLVIVPYCLLSCKSYYLGESESVIPLYADQYGTSVVYNIPVGERYIVMRGYGNYCYAQYRDYYGWLPVNRIHYISRLSKRNLYNYYTNYGSYSALSSSASVHSTNRNRTKITKLSMTHFRNAPGNGSHSGNQSRIFGGRSRH